MKMDPIIRSVLFKFAFSFMLTALLTSRLMIGEKPAYVLMTFFILILLILFCAVISTALDLLFKRHPYINLFIEALVISGFLLMIAFIGSLTIQDASANFLFLAGGAGYSCIVGVLLFLRSIVRILLSKSKTGNREESSFLTGSVVRIIIGYSLAAIAILLSNLLKDSDEWMRTLGLFSIIVIPCAFISSILSIQMNNNPFIRLFVETVTTTMITVLIICCARAFSYGTPSEYFNHLVYQVCIFAALLFILLLHKNLYQLGAFYFRSPIASKKC